MKQTKEKEKVKLLHEKQMQDLIKDVEFVSVWYFFQSLFMI